MADYFEEFVKTIEVLKYEDLDDREIELARFKGTGSLYVTRHMKTLGPLGPRDSKRFKSEQEQDARALYEQWKAEED